MNFIRFLLLIVSLLVLTSCSVYFGVRCALLNVITRFRVNFYSPMPPFEDEDGDDINDDSEEM